MQELLSAADLADRLGVSHQTVARWGRTGRIPRVVISRKTIRYDWQAVLAALQAAPTSEGAADE